LTQSKKSAKKSYEKLLDMKQKMRYKKQNLVNSIKFPMLSIMQFLRECSAALLNTKQPQLQQSEQQFQLQDQSHPQPPHLPFLGQSIETLGYCLVSAGIVAVLAGFCFFYLISTHVPENAHDHLTHHLGKHPQKNL